MSFHIKGLSRLLSLLGQALDVAVHEPSQLIIAPRLPPLELQPCHLSIIQTDAARFSVSRNAAWIPRPRDVQECPFPAKVRPFGIAQPFQILLQWARSSSFDSGMSKYTGAQPPVKPFVAENNLLSYR